MVLRANDPGFLRALIEEGRVAVKRHLQGPYEALTKYTGGFYTETRGGSDEFTPENMYFEYMTAMIPRLVFHNPRVRVASRRDGPQQDVAVAMKHGLNRLVRDEHLNLLLRDVALDMLFAWGVVLVKETSRDGLSLAEDDPIHPAQPTWPVGERVPPTKFFMDPQAYDWESTRYRGHEWRMDKEDLLERAREHPDEGWNVEAIEELATGTENDLGVDRPDHGDEHSVTREEICAYDVWFPEIELPDSPGADEGFHGTIYTIALTQSRHTGILGSDGDEWKKPSKEGFIREPRPFYGPRTGPYSLFGVYKVPDSPFPLAPLCAVEAQIRELNVHARVSSENMRKHKRFIGVRDNSTAQKLANNPHDHVMALDGDDVRQSMVQGELAGMSEHTQSYLVYLNQRARRLLGIDEALSGNVSGEGTATEHTIASESAMARLSEIKAAFDRGTTDVLYTLAHYLYYSETSVFPVSDEVFAEEEVELPEYPGLSIEPWFRGGDPDRSKGYTFDDLELDIEPYSMERTSEGLQMQRMMQAHEIIRGDMPLWAQYPDFPWKDWYKKIGDAMNLPNLEELVRPEMLERLTEQLQMMMQAQTQAEPQMAASQGPRFGGQVGGGGQRGGAAGGKSQASQGQGPATGARMQGQGMAGQQAGGMLKPMKLGA